MKRSLVAAAIAMAVLSVPAAQAAPMDVVQATSTRVNAFIDEWHDDAAHANPRYFDKMAEHGVFIGTDKTERWEREAFRVWAKPYFDRHNAWSFKALERHVTVAQDGHYAWFDEQLATPFGVCQASGVVHVTAEKLEIEHYQLSVAVPNEVLKDVTELVKRHEGQGGKP